MAAKEILTIQLGEFSNVLGALWWNMQDVSPVSANKSDIVDNENEQRVFFREGKSNKVSINPRLLAVDLKGPMDFPIQNQEFDLSSQDTSPHKIDLIPGDHAPSLCEQISSIQLASSEFESNDFHEWKALFNNKLHPKSLNTLNNIQSVSALGTFNLFSQGMACLEKEDNLEYMENQIRFFVEESDYFQGFNMLFDADNGFGGAASKLLQLIQQEYSTKTTFTIPLFPAHSMCESARRVERLTNLGLVVETLFEDSSMFSPVSLDPFWCSTNSRKFSGLQNLKPTSIYQAGAVIATALDTIFFPLHAKKGYLHSLSDFVKKLTSDGRKAVGMSCAIPLWNRISNLESLNSAFLEVTSLTPCVENFRDCWTQQLVWRGLPNLSDFQSLVEFWSRTQWKHTTTFNCVFSTPSSLVKPYPEFFLDSPNLVEDSTWNPSKIGPNFCTFGGLHNSVSLGHSLRNLHTELSKIERTSLQKFLSSGMEQDDLLENRNRIISYAELYEES
ncbi:protein misato homolog 1-like [Daphnia carinata]|uniref:protein misato homolog 1-like n=1 Tax=Daphnia carinata TaxID=120202 RepID=UPI00257C71BE|nr:protein misato homolog 1-like [Daphnia carinata]